ncbi:MAG: Gfo/Idh/MocA family oxidoreductase, partial [Planctomycetes bacterium]|nr:Gfo/Idh/MocA family oxidoreductase [Planctomycetota bacterium]
MGISIGMVGLGAFGKSFAELFKKHPLVDRIGLCDVERDRIDEFAKRQSWRDKFKPSDAYESLDDICRSDLDAIVVITQPWLHAPQCLQVLESGKHVYSAVPIISIPDGDEILDWCDKLVNACKKTGKHYMLGETTYYRPEAMYCRRRAAEGAFGDFVYSEGEYLHPFDSSCDLREVAKQRLSSKTGRQWPAVLKTYTDRGILAGPMHYPTHSTSGPISVMNAHAVKVCAWGYANRTGEPYFNDTKMAFSNETALFHMSNGATMRICEHRELGHKARETFRVYGTRGSFENNTWSDQMTCEALTVEQMRDPLDEEVAKAWTDASTESVSYGGHGGSHAYLVHEFVDAIAHDRSPAINIYVAVRYMAAGVMAHKSALAG